MNFHQVKFVFSQFEMKTEMNIHAKLYVCINASQRNNNFWFEIYCVRDKRFLRKYSHKSNYFNKLRQQIDLYFETWYDNETTTCKNIVLRWEISAFKCAAYNWSEKKKKKKNCRTKSQEKNKYKKNGKRERTNEGKEITTKRPYIH